MDSDKNKNNLNPIAIPIDPAQLVVANQTIPNPHAAVLLVMPTSEKDLPKPEVTIEHTSPPIPQRQAKAIDELILIRPQMNKADFVNQSSDINNLPAENTDSKIPVENLSSISPLSGVAAAPIIPPEPKDIIPEMLTLKNSAPVAQFLAEVKNIKSEVIPESKPIPLSLISQMKPTDDVILEKPDIITPAENPIGTKNIQAAWSHFHPQKEELVEDYKGTGIYSYVETPIIEKPAVLKMPTQNIPPQPIMQVVKTFKKDVEEAVKYNHVSSIDIAVAEQKHRLEQQRAALMNPSTGEDVKKFQIIMYIIVGLVLIIGGISLIYYFVIPAVTQTTATNAIKKTAGYNLLRTEEKETIDLNKIDVTKLPAVLRNEIETKSISPNNILEIVFSKTDDAGQVTNIDSLSFLSLVGITPPVDIIRDLQKPFIYGLHNLGNNQPFLILYTGAYSSGFNGMWAWQTGGMLNGFKKIFIINDSSVASSANPQTKKDLYFEDAVIRSLNSWVMKDSSGKIILAYTIFDTNTVIISTNVATIKAIIDRMIVEKTQTTR